jgi:hypothetical protein
MTLKPERSPTSLPRERRAAVLGYGAVYVLKRRDGGTARGCRATKSANVIVERASPTLARCVIAQQYLMTLVDDRVCRCAGKFAFQR